MVPLARLQASALLASRGQRDPIAADVVPSGDDMTVTFATDVEAAALTKAARVVASRGRDSVRLAVPVVEVPAPNARLLGILRSRNTAGSDTDQVVNARTVPDGTYKWLLMPGTVVDITGRQNTSTRVRLDDALDVWVASDDIVVLPEGSAMPRRITGGVRVAPAADWVDVGIATGERPAFLIEPDGRTLTLTLYGVQANPEISPILGNDTLVRRISWDQVGTNRVRFTFTLSQPVYGWLPLWDEARRAFVLRIRRLPTVDAARPLAGLTIAVDPGHPPAGATGPTGLFEGDAVLPVGKLLFELLRARGAMPVMTRETFAPLGLTERAVAARRMNAHAFVSIHLNGLPDGVNPFTANGTSTLFFHQSSEALARPVQSALVARFGLRDLGVHYQNLAVARPTWYPSVLTEGLFLMMPEQEAAMRDPAFQRRYAEAIDPDTPPVVTEVGICLPGASLDDVRAAADFAYLRRAAAPEAPNSESQAVRVVDLFAGCGAMSLGLTEACRALGMRAEHVAGFEVHPRVAEVYAHNFGLADMKPQDLAEILLPNIESTATKSENALVERLGRVDFVCAGPPCKGHSNLNNRTRREDPRNALYFLVARFAKLTRPRWIVIENVIAVLHDKAQVVQRTQEALESLGYETADGIIDLWTLGVAQTRRRHILVAQLRSHESGEKRELPFLDDLMAPYLTRHRPISWAIEDLLDVPTEKFMDSPRQPDRSSTPKIFPHPGLRYATQPASCHWAQSASSPHPSASRRQPAWHTPLPRTSQIRETA